MKQVSMERRGWILLFIGLTLATLMINALIFESKTQRAALAKTDRTVDKLRQESERPDMSGVWIHGKEVKKLWVAKCTNVLAGDAIEIEFKGEKQKVRFSSVDSPELQQSFGEAAKRYIEACCLGQLVTIWQTDTDSDGLAWAFVKPFSQDDLETSDNLSELLLSNGLAWCTENVSRESQLAAIESQARNAENGLWSDDESIPPWEWKATRQ